MLYIHIPFCKKICYYCDFYFSLNLSNKADYISALCKEIALKRDYLASNKLQTIYFGGGTPSVLTKDEIHHIFDTITRFFDISELQECTLEANPDDLTIEYLNDLRQTPINRLSIGIQSFRDDDLLLMNRRHTSDEAFSCVKNAKDAGFQNITIDLMYGLPNQTQEKWLKNIEAALLLDVHHISAYHLTIEENTAFNKFLKNNILAIPPEEESIVLYNSLVEILRKRGFLHYEISNFAKPGYEAIHNSNYWKQKHYIGVGSSAHSFNGSQRQWNVSNNLKYIAAITRNDIFCEVEELSITNRFNEFLLTSLRTMWGVDIARLKNTFPVEYYTIFERKMSYYLDQSLAVRTESAFILTEEGFFVSDAILADLFIVD